MGDWYATQRNRTGTSKTLLKNLSVIMVSHQKFSRPVSIYGTAEFLQRETQAFVHIVYQITSAKPSLVKEYARGHEIRSLAIRNIATPRFISYLLSVLKTWVLVWKLRRSFDVFLGYDELNAAVGILLRYFGVVRRSVWYLQDYYPSGLFANPILDGIYRVLGRFVARHSDYCWGCSDRICEEILRQGAQVEAVQLVPPGVSSEMLRLGVSDEPRALKDESRLVHIGALLPDRGLQLVIRCLPSIITRHHALKLVVIGQGPFERHLKEMAKRLGVADATQFLGFQPPERAIDELRYSSIALATYMPATRDTPVYYAFPSKVLQCLALGLPVIVTRGTSFAKEIEQRKAGIVIEYDEKALITAVSRLLEDRALRKETSENGHRLALEYDREEILLSALKPLLLSLKNSSRICRERRRTGGSE